MILSASRRTDIPSFYADWLFRRLDEGYCLVKNPFNPNQIRRVSLLPQNVDGMVLWTKNAARGCNCAASVDIGAYHTCRNGCRYYYANPVDAKTGAYRHDSESEIPAP